MKKNEKMQEILAFAASVWQSVGKFLQTAYEKPKNAFIKFKDASPHYGLRASFAFVLSVYLVYLLKCFLTIPVKDYYFDVYTNSPDSIVAQIDFTIGNRNILNTYSSKDSISVDECKISYKAYKYNNNFYRQYHNKYFLSDESKKLIQFFDSIRSYSYHDSTYADILKNYDSHVFNIKNDTLLTYIYTHQYQNYASSNPMGMISLSDFKRKLPAVYPNQHSSSQTIHKRIDIHFIESPLVEDLFLSIFLDSTSFNKLSLNHQYASYASIQYCRSIQSAQEELSYGKVESVDITNSLAIAQPAYKNLYRKFPRLLLMLSKEDISQVNYRFSFKSTSIDSYQINLHTRGCAIINNNPSDELRVLSLHDTQVLKNKKNAYYYDSNFSESEILATFPENNAIQYARLFFVTLVLGWFIRAFLKNLWKIIKRK
ncbi:MAG: hypothetical protein IK073_05835 [Paludibacteraceae bacterium]|nr:hypothetical protein [Paludibacteraceae bacterium]